MQKTKKKQIDEHLYQLLLKYFCVDEKPDPRDAAEIRRLLEKKVADDVAAQWYFTANKDPKATPEEKAEARRKYCEYKGIPFH